MHGFAAVSVRDIANKAGVNKALVFYYYGFQTLGDEDGMRGIGLACGPVGDLRRLQRYKS